MYWEKVGPSILPHKGHIANNCLPFQPGNDADTAPTGHARAEVRDGDA